METIKHGGTYLADILYTLPEILIYLSGVWGKVSIIGWRNTSSESETSNPFIIVYSMNKC